MPGFQVPGQAYDPYTGEPLNPDEQAAYARLQQSQQNGFTFPAPQADGFNSAYADRSYPSPVSYGNSPKTLEDARSLAASQPPAPEIDPRTGSWLRQSASEQAAGLITAPIAPWSYATQGDPTLGRVNPYGVLDVALSPLTYAIPGQVAEQGAARVARGLVGVAVGQQIADRLLPENTNPLVRVGVDTLAAWAGAKAADRGGAIVRGINATGDAAALRSAAGAGEYGRGKYQDVAFPRQRVAGGAPFDEQSLYAQQAHLERMVGDDPNLSSAIAKIQDNLAIEEQLRARGGIAEQELKAGRRNQLGRVGTARDEAANGGMTISEAARAASEEATTGKFRKTFAPGTNLTDDESRAIARLLATSPALEGKQGEYLNYTRALDEFLKGGDIQPEQRKRLSDLLGVQLEQKPQPARGANGERFPEAGTNQYPARMGGTHTEFTTGDGTRQVPNTAPVTQTFSNAPQQEIAGRARVLGGDGQMKEGVIQPSLFEPDKYMVVDPQTGQPIPDFRPDGTPIPGSEIRSTVTAARSPGGPQQFPASVPMTPRPAEALDLQAPPLNNGQFTRVDPETGRPTGANPLNPELLTEPPLDPVVRAERAAAIAEWEKANPLRPGEYYRVDPETGLPTKATPADWSGPDAPTDPAVAAERQRAYEEWKRAVLLRDGEYYRVDPETGTPTRSTPPNWNGPENAAIDMEQVRANDAAAAARRLPKPAPEDHPTWPGGVGNFPSAPGAVNMQGPESLIDPVVSAGPNRGRQVAMPGVTRHEQQRGTIWQNVKDILSGFRTVQSAGDVSMTSRQARRTMIAYNRAWRTAVKDEIGAFVKNEDAAWKVSDRIDASPNRAKYDEMGIDLPDPNNYDLSVQEEAFMHGSSMAARVVQRVPLVKRSERAAAVFMKSLRSGIADDFIGKFTPEQWSRLSVDDKQAIGKFINAVSGRGMLPEVLQSHAQTLGAVFYSPRNQIANVQIPATVFFGRSSEALGRNAIGIPKIRAEAAKALVADYASKWALRGLIIAAGGKVGLDINSSDWGKIITPDGQRIDMDGGDNQMMRLIANLYAGGTTSRDSGVFTQRDRREIAWNYLRNKFAPVPGTADRLTDNIPNDSPEEEAFKAGAYLWLQDVVNAVRASKEQGKPDLSTARMALSALVGGQVGISVDSPRSPGLTTKSGNFDDLSPEQQATELGTLTWDKAGKAPNVPQPYRDEISQYASHKAWADAATETYKQRYIDAFKQRGENLEPGLAQVYAERALQQNPIQKLYSGARNAYEREWVVANPQLAVKFMNEDAKLPKDERRLSLSLEEVAFLVRQSRQN